jgi:hypothetical protein
VLSGKLDELLLHHNTLLKGLGAPTFEKQALLDRLLELAPLLLPFAEAVWDRLDDAARTGKRVLFEGAQAVMLDVDHGTYPYVTSSNTVAGNAAAGAGVGPGRIGYVLGIAKAYTTRVGSGPFPTELHDDTGRLLGERGHEFGTVTGRPRRCGWFDAAMVRQAAKVGGVDGLVLTKLDVLDGLQAPSGLDCRAGCGRAGLRGHPRLVRLDARRAQLCRAAGGGGEVHPPHRGAGGGAGRAAQHLARARRHHRVARSVCGLIPAAPSSPRKLCRRQAPGDGSAALARRTGGGRRSAPRPASRPHLDGGSHEPARRVPQP